jgi:glycosyltransferase involved in cell wall biosynthesis
MYYWRLLSFLARHRGGTIHFTGVFKNELILFEGVLINACFKILGGRYVYTAHNVLPHNREQSRFFRWIYRIAYKFPDVIVVHTELARLQLIGQFGVAAERLRVISIGLNEEVPLTSLGAVEARARLGFGAGERLILFFGTIDEYKGLDLLIEAFGRLRQPETRLVIAGAFRTPACRDQILRMVATSPRRDQIRLDARLISNDEIEVYFKACDVLCLPYRNVYQSGVFFLGSRFGIPMVATRVGSLADFLMPEAGVLARSNDAAGISEGLSEFLASAGRFRRDEITAAAQKFRWDRICRVLMPLYEAGNETAPGPFPS